jgi:RHS repeat-associated protein
LSSVRAITDAAGVKIETALYKPFGEQSEWLLPGNAAPETKGWIGERYDADAGLQYLNARYYDPELSLFLQPDWFEVTKAGVGTNRFSYSFNDPVNKIDPGGNAVYRDIDGDGKNEYIGQAKDIYGDRADDSKFTHSERTAAIESYYSRMSVTMSSQDGSELGIEVSTLYSTGGPGANIIRDTSGSIYVKIYAIGSPGRVEGVAYSELVSKSFEIEGGRTVSVPVRTEGLDEKYKDPAQLTQLVRRALNGGALAGVAAESVDAVGRRSGTTYKLVMSEMVGYVYVGTKTVTRYGIPVDIPYAIPTPKLTIVVSGGKLTGASAN